MNDATVVIAQTFRRLAYSGENNSATMTGLTNSGWSGGNDQVATVPKGLKVTQSTFEEHFISSDLRKAMLELGPNTFAHLFQVLGFTTANSSNSSSGSKHPEGSISYEAFVCATYLLSCARKEERLRLLFNMFDVNFSGFLKKKEFRAMAGQLTQGAAHMQQTQQQPQEQKEPHNIVTNPFGSNSPPSSTGNTNFRALDRMMIDAGMQLYDTNKDGKLSFEEWCVFAREDSAIARCLIAMTQDIKPLFI